MVSPYVTAERDRLQLIPAIGNLGSVTPINIWISPVPAGEHIY
ncbi:hypothetical protein [Trichocoleus desertorum]